MKDAPSPRVLTISNWYCPQCKRQVARDDAPSGLHLTCRTKVEWKDFRIWPIGQCPDDG